MDKKDYTNRFAREPDVADLTLEQLKEELASELGVALDELDRVFQVTPDMQRIKLDDGLWQVFYFDDKKRVQLWLTRRKGGRPVGVEFMVKEVTRIDPATEKRSEEVCLELVYKFRRRLENVRRGQPASSTVRVGAGARFKVWEI